MRVRHVAVAGTWYPGTAARLTAEVERYLDDASREAAGDRPDPDRLVALIAPHAGLVYSGPVAASAYRLLRDRPYDAIVLVGPSHYIGFDGASVWPHGAFETPIGSLPIHEELAAALIAACPRVRDFPEAHAREHSLEMQLPFLAMLAPQIPIVPIVMGFQTRATAFDLGEAIAEVCRRRPVLLVASSDLSHFYDARTAAALDGQVLQAVAALDDEGLMALLEARPDHACGGGPMVAVARAARAMGATSSRVLRYADSGDVSGDKSSVVGYMAAAIWQ